MLNNCDAWFIATKYRAVVVVVKRFENAADVLYLIDPDIYEAMLDEDPEDGQ